MLYHKDPEIPEAEGTLILSSVTIPQKHCVLKSALGCFRIYVRLAMHLYFNTTFKALEIFTIAYTWGN